MTIIIKKHRYFPEAFIRKLRDRTPLDIIHRVRLMCFHPVLHSLHFIESGGTSMYHEHLLWVFASIHREYTIRISICTNDEFILVVIDFIDLVNLSIQTEWTSWTGSYHWGWFFPRSPEKLSRTSNILRWSQSLHKTLWRTPWSWVLPHSLFLALW